MNASLRVLLIGGSEAEEVAAQLLRAGYGSEATCVETPEAFARALNRDWDLAICAPGPNDRSALDSLRRIRESGRDLPCIVIQPEPTECDVLAALRAGAEDCLNRGDIVRLVSAVAREGRAARLRRERINLEGQLRHAEKMEAVARLAGGVAHDFNNLLTVITGYSDLLLSSSRLSEPQRTALDQIRRSADRAGDLTRQLMALSLRQPLDTRPIRVAAFVSQIVKGLRRGMGDNIQMSVIPSASADTVEADPGRLEQAVRNILLNARDAMPHGGQLTIETGIVHFGDAMAADLGLRSGPHVFIAVSDTGVGMDRDTLSHVFEPFFTTKGSGGGAGMGLATAYAAIHQCGGAIGIDSELNKGSEVRIYLPLAEASRSLGDNGLGCRRATG